MQRSGSMPQAVCANDPAGASVRSLSDAHSVFNAPANQLGAKYEIKKKIELYKGSVSTVYKCILSGGKAVVIKTYHKGKMAEKHFHKLEREIAAMRALCREVGKRGVVQLLDTFEDAQGIYLVMECCEGGDLFKRLMLHGGKLSEHWVCVEVIAPLLRVLERMHGLHLMHRDIKPENIFITADGQVKLGDFGLAIDWTQELPFSRSGTLDYMAPEVLMNPATHTQESPSITVPQLHAKSIRPYTAAVDVWAVGCLAYELVCGRPPFEVEDEKQTASLIIYSHNIHFEPTANPAWTDFVTQALIKDPRQRPDAATLLGHQWIRSNLDRAAAAAERAPSAAAAAYGRAASSVAAAADAAAAERAPSPVAASSGGSSVCGTASVVGDGGSNSSCVGIAAYLGSSSGGGGSSGAVAAQQQRTCTPSTTAHGFRTAAALLATRASQQSPSTPQPPPMSAAAATSATTSPVTGSGAVYGSGMVASAQPQPRSAPPTQAAASGGFRSGNGGGGSGSSGALRSLLDAFKSASICSSAAATNIATCAERAAGTPSVAAAAAGSANARPPSAGSYYRCSSGAAVSSGAISASVSSSGAVGGGGVTGGGSNAGQLLRTSFQFQLPAERDTASGSGKQMRSPSKTFQVQIPLSSERERDRARDRERDRESSWGGTSTAAVVGAGCRAQMGSGSLTTPSPQAAAVIASAREFAATESYHHQQHHQQVSAPLLTRAASPVQLPPQRALLSSSGSSGGLIAAGGGGNGGGSGGSPVGAGSGGFGSPSRIARGGAATTGGLLTSQGGSAALLATMPRPLGSLSSAGVCGRVPSPPSQQRSDMSLMAAANMSPNVAGHGAKPPRPLPDSPGKALAPSPASSQPAAAQPPPCGGGGGSVPALRASVCASPPRLQPANGGTGAAWAAGSGPTSASPSALHDLTHNWGAVVSISVNKLSHLVGNGRRSGSGSTFSSPQRLPVQGGGGGGGGKGLDSYGLPTPTPVASGLPPGEYCSPRPVGVLERVKYHLRGGGGVGVASSPTHSMPSALQQPQPHLQLQPPPQQQQQQQLSGAGAGSLQGPVPGLYGSHALTAAPVAAMDVI